jgi:hypothetical protein
MIMHKGRLSNNQLIITGYKSVIGFLKIKCYLK